MVAEKILQNLDVRRADNQQITIVVERSVAQDIRQNFQIAVIPQIDIFRARVIGVFAERESQIIVIAVMIFSDVFRRIYPHIIIAQIAFGDFQLLEILRPFKRQKEKFLVRIFRLRRGGNRLNLFDIIALDIGFSVFKAASKSVGI